MIDILKLTSIFVWASEEFNCEISISMGWNSCIFIVAVCEKSRENKEIGRYVEENIIASLKLKTESTKWVVQFTREENKRDQYETPPRWNMYISPKLIIHFVVKYI